VTLRFCVFDGLEFLDDEQLHLLADVLASSKRAHRGLRILLTGSVSALKIVDRTLSHSLSTIALDSKYPNQSDVVLVTEAKLGVMYRVVSDPTVIESLEAKPRSEPWAQELQTMSGTSGLKIAVSKMIARRWLLSNIFWTQSDIYAFFQWFATVPSVGLINKAVREEPYDRYRTTDWFNPPNWRKIEAWVAKECQPDDSAIFAIQKAAVDCALGGARKERIQLLEPYSKTEWLALAWLAEALSLIQGFSAAFDAIDQCLDLIVQSNTDPATVQKIIDCFLGWTGQWHSPTKDLQIREKMVELSRLKLGIVSAGMWVGTLLRIVEVTGWEGGFDYQAAS
jgi:hypothetical protein